MRTVVVLPTYNEAENIADLLKALRHASPDIDVVVVDDSSPDGTGELAEAAATELGGVTVIHRAAKDGLGAAYRHGFAAVLEGDYQVIVTMDADFSHDPATIPRMIDSVAGGADVVIGSRYVPGGGSQDWPLHRRMLSRWGNRYTSGVLRLPASDCTSGFRAYRAAKLAAIDPASTTSEGYAFLTELLRRLHRDGARVVEIPIVFRDRERGKSKMSGAIIAESMAVVTRWAAQDLTAAIRGRLRRRGVSAR